MNKKEIWLKLKAYHFEDVVPLYLWDHVIRVFGGEDASTKAFANKLTRKCGWTNEFALKAIAEYKKFVYLGVVSDFNVTPSKIIDQVWHEHLLFSKAYRHFCNDVISYHLDHNPELIPMTDQTGTFNVQYMDTIALYKTEFGIDPPAEIWSIPKFDQKKAAASGYESNKKTRKNNYTRNTFSDATLVSFFEGSQQAGYSSQSLPEFGGFGGGNSGGAGAGGSWDDNNSNVDSQGISDGNAGSSDSGGDGGSSGCSSGCGGGD